MKQRIRILETIRQGSIGGGETYLMNLVSNLDRERFEPIVLAFTDGEMITRLRQLGIECHVIYTEKPFHFPIYKQVLALIQEKEIDLVHFHGSRAGTNTLLPARQARKPILYTVHGWSFHTGNNPLVTLGRKITERFMVSRCNVTICGSKADLEQGKALNRRKRFELVYNSIDTSVYSPTGNWSNLRAEWGIPEDAFLVAFLSRVTFQKDPLTFVRAIPLVLNEEPAIRFILIGDGELKAQCIAEAQALGITADQLQFDGFRTDIGNVHTSTDVFVLPSLWEVVPLALLEAMAMEKLCIATNIPGTTEALRHGNNGLLFTPGDTAGLAEQILFGYRNRQRRAELQAAARKTVTEEFDLRKLVRRNEEIYATVAAEQQQQ